MTSNRTANHLNNKPVNKTNTLPRTHVQITQPGLNQYKEDSSVSSDTNKIPVTSKIAKRLGLSPRFKRKIVETIANKVSSHAHNSNLNHKSTVSYN